MPKRLQQNSAALNRKLIAIAVASCFAADFVLANPTLPTVVHGAATIHQAGNLLQVTNSPSAIINWGGFSINTNEITRFIQQSASSSVLNRVIGQEPSAILGALQSNGRVFLINPNGILFGAGAQINVAGLVASTLNLSDTDFLAGRMRFTEMPEAGSVVNQGAINTSQGGSVYLVAPDIANSGVITSPRGEVILAAGKSVELVNPAIPNLRVEIVASENEARNLGQIVTDSGRIGIYAGLINHSGTLRADTVEVGKNGEVLLKANKNIVLESGSVMSASGNPGGVHDGGTVRIVAEDTLDMRRGSAVHVDGGVDGGNGGFLELSGKQQIALNGEFTGRALKGGYRHGSLLLDPLNINIGALGITTTISLASGPGSIVVKQDGTRVYVVRPSMATFGSDFIEVIDTSTNAIITTIDLADGSNAAVSGMALSPDGSRLYAVYGNTGASAGYIKVVDTATNTVATTYGVSGPTNLFGAVVDSSNRIYTAGNVPFTSTAQMVVIDGTTGTQLDAVAVAFNPQQIVVNPSGTRVYVVSVSPNVVLQEFATGTNALLSSTPLVVRPAHQAVSSDGATLYLAYGNQIEARSTSTLATVMDTIPVGADRLVVSGGSAFVSLNGSVSVVDLSTKTARQTFAIGPGGSSQGLGFNAANNSVYATPPIGNQLAVIGLNAGTDTTAGGVILHTDAPGSTLNLPVSALNGAWSNVNLAATNNVSVNSPLLDSSVPSGGTLTLTAGNDVNINAWIGEPTARFNHDLTLIAGNNVNINSSIYQGNNALTLAADANIPAQGITPNATGSINIKASSVPIIVDTPGSMTVTGQDFNVQAGKGVGVLVNVGGLLDANLTGNFLLQGGSDNYAQAGDNIDALATIQASAVNIAAAGTITVAGGDDNYVGIFAPGTNSASINANATLSATTSINLSGTSIMVRGGDYNSASASSGNNNVTVNANALVSAGTGITVAGANLTVRGGGSASANAYSNGVNTANANANATLAAGQAMTLTLNGAVTIAGGNSAQAYASGNATATANANAAVSAGTDLVLDGNPTSLTVMGGTAWASAYSGEGGTAATANANANVALTAGQSMSLNVAGPVVIAGNSTEAYGYADAGSTTVNSNANGAVTAGTTLALTATSLTVRGGDYASASASGAGNNAATANANASLVSSGNMTLTATSGGVLIRGGDGGSATASSGGINNATTNANALVSSGGLLTMNATGGLTVRGGNNGSASASDNGNNTAVLNTNASVLAGTMNLTVAGPVLIQGGSGASAEASCCGDANAINSATINTNAVVRANNGLTLTVTGGSVTIAGGDNAGAEASEASGQFTAAANAKGELSTAAGPLTVSVTGGSLTVRGGNDAYASASASSNFAQANATVVAPGRLVAGGNLSINTTGGVNIRGGDYASASADGTSAGTRAISNINADAVVTAGGSITVTTPSLNVQGGNSAYAEAYDWGQNSALATANAYLAAGTDLALTVADGIVVAGGNNAAAYASNGSPAGILAASTSTGALISAGGMASINAGSLTIAGGIQSASYGAFAGGSGINTATTLANANIATTGDFNYTGGTMTLMGGLARAQGGTGVAASTSSEANAGTQITGVKMMSISGDLMILGGSAFDDGFDAANGVAMARAVLDPAVLAISTLGDVMMTGGSVTGFGSAYSTMMAPGPIDLTIAGSTGLILTGGGGSTGFSADPSSPITVTYTGGGTQNVVNNALLDSASIQTALFIPPPPTSPPILSEVPVDLEIVNQVLITSVNESGSNLAAQQSTTAEEPIDPAEKKKKEKSMVCR